MNRRCPQVGTTSVLMDATEFQRRVDAELDRQVRSLNAERQRPGSGERTSVGSHLTIDELMQRLIASLHDLYRTPPDNEGA